MKNLVIGNTSQQSYYYPEDYLKIPSRNVDMNFLKENSWNSVYITFAEQRVYDKGIDFISPNYFYTIKIIENIIHNSNKIVIFTSCELWNNCIGKVYIDTPFSYTSSNDYLFSKHLLYSYILKKRNEDEEYKKVVIIHPFNFNSVHRNKYFLFGKIFDSIINKKKIEIGDTYFYRDMIHTKYLVERSISATCDDVIGSGRMCFVNDYIRDLYRYFKMDYDYYVIEKKTNIYSEKLYYSYQDKIYHYDSLLNDSINDIKNQL